MCCCIECKNVYTFIGGCAKPALHCWDCFWIETIIKRLRECRQEGGKENEKRMSEREEGGNEGYIERVGGKNKQK